MNHRRPSFFSPLFWAMGIIAIIFGLFYWISHHEPTPASTTHTKILDQNDNLDIAVKTPLLSPKSSVTTARQRSRPSIAKTAVKAKPQKAAKAEKKQKKKVKKKKKKNKSGTSGESDASEDVLDNDTEENDSANSRDSVDGTDIRGGVVSGMVTSIDPKTLEEWRTYLFSMPELTKVTKFVEAYMSHDVTSDIFYTLTYEMMENSLLILREMGVVALGATPSEDSFVGLTHFQERETGELRERIHQFLESYIQLSHLNILGDVLTTDEPRAQIQAALLLQKAAQRYLTANSDGNDNGTKEDPITRPGRGIGTEPNRPGLPRNTLVSRFQNFYRQLERLFKTASSGDVRRVAQQSMDTLQNLLGTRNSNESVISAL